MAAPAGDLFLHFGGAVQNWHDGYRLQMDMWHRHDEHLPFAMLMSYRLNSTG
jgi:hypothetical protein